MPIWDKPEGAVDVRCPGAYCSSWLIEVAPGIYQCWACLRWKLTAYAFSEVIGRGNEVTAVVAIYNKVSGEYQIGDATWTLDKFGCPKPGGFLRDSKLMRVPPEEAQFMPLPVVPVPWPREGWPKGLERWNPDWMFPQAAGPKELQRASPSSRS